MKRSVNGRQYESCKQSFGLTDLPPGENGRHLVDDIFRCKFMNKKICILIKILLTFVPPVPIDNNPALFG